MLQQHSSMYKLGKLRAKTTLPRNSKHSAKNRGEQPQQFNANLITLKNNSPLDQKNKFKMQHGKKPKTKCLHDDGVVVAENGRACRNAAYRNNGLLEGTKINTANCNLKRNREGEDGDADTHTHRHTHTPALRVC